jgi:hypothetical protein
LNYSDHFLSVTANYLSSCFGCSLKKLVFYGEPIRVCKKTETMKEPLLVPKELWRVFDVMKDSRNITEDDLLMGAPVLEVEAARESMDTGTQFEGCSVKALCTVVFEFLRCLKDPVIPPAILKVF